MLTVNQTRRERPLPRNTFLVAVLRALLGIILMWKGITLLRNSALTESLIAQTNVDMFANNAQTLAFVVSYLSLLCGFFILIGLFTRWASILLIPVLVVAAFFVNIRQVNTNLFEFILSLVALGLLILFAIRGSREYAADQYLSKKEPNP